MRHLARATLQQLTAASLDDETAAQLVQAAEKGEGPLLVQALLRLSRHYALLLLLDQVEQLAAEEWLVVERQLIEPLAHSGRVVVVLASARPIPRWHRFEARRRVLNTEKSRLDPFPMEEVMAQIVRSALPLSLTAATYSRYSAGIPALVDALAHEAAVWNHETAESPRDSSWLEKNHSANVVDYLRRAEDHLLHSVPLRLRYVLDQVAPLRFCRLGSLRAMIENAPAGNHGLADPALSDADYLLLLRQLEQTGVIWWERSLNAYLISSAARRVIHMRLQLENNGRSARALNHCAITLYWQWANADPGACEEAIREIWFHLSVVEAGKRRPHRLHRRIHRALSFARSHLPPSRLLALRDQLAHDEELAQLLPAALHRDLLLQLDKQPSAVYSTSSTTAHTGTTLFELLSSG